MGHDRMLVAVHTLLSGLNSKLLEAVSKMHAMLRCRSPELGDRLGLERPALRGADSGAGSSGGPRAILC